MAESRPPSILIAEDDPYLREAYTRRFARTPFRVRVAVNGTETVEMIRQEAPDLLLCDIIMPERDGWWVLEQYQQEKRSFPVIMLTNLDDNETRKRSMAMGAVGFFVKKDMSLHTLVEMAEKILSSGHL